MVLKLSLYNLALLITDYFCGTVFQISEELKNPPKTKPRTHLKKTTHFSSVESYSEVQCCYYSEMQILCFYKSTFYLALSPFGEKIKIQFSILNVFFTKTVKVEQFSMFMHPSAMQKTKQNKKTQELRFSVCTYSHTYLSYLSFFQNI